MKIAVDQLENFAQFWRLWLTTIVIDDVCTPSPRNPRRFAAFRQISRGGDSRYSRDATFVFL